MVRKRSNFGIIFVHMPKIPHLRDLRERKFLSQRELADSAGVSRSTITNLEAGKEAQGKTIRALAKAMDVEPSVLVGKG